MGMVRSVDEIRLYGRCSLAWFWRHQTRLDGSHARDQVIADALRQAVAWYAVGDTTSLRVAYEDVWRDWCLAWGEESVATDLLAYSAERRKILALFERGTIRAPSGAPYKAPRMTRQYRESFERAGLARLAERLDRWADGKGLHLSRLDGMTTGSAFGDAFADSWERAAACDKPGPKSLPVPASILGVDVPYACRLPQLTLEGAASLAIRQRTNTVVLEVHQYARLERFRPALAGRDLRTQAALLSNGAGEVVWDEVERVDFRYWPTGDVYSFAHANIGFLQSVAAAAERGIQNGIVLPRFVAGFEACQGCEFLPHCSGDGWEALPFVDGSLLAVVEQSRRSGATAPAAPAGGRP